MDLSQARDLAMKFEGLRLKAYSDPAGIETIGYGHKITSGESFPNGITTLDAQTLLESDLLEAEAAIHRLVKVGLTQGQFNALADFVFNLGSGRLAESTLLKLLNMQQYSRIPDELIKWVMGGGVVLSGLIDRRKAEIDLWNSTPAGV